MTEDKNWSKYVKKFADAFESGRQIKNISAGPSDLKGKRKKEGVKVVICSPHPDDEADCGGLALRLLRENDAQVMNIAMTLGGDADRKEARKNEMAAACDILGFDWQLIEEPGAWENLHLDIARKFPDAWQEKIAKLAGKFKSHSPEVIIFPHADDAHPTHVGVHHLALAAAVKYSCQHNGKTIIAETECWRPLADPNLLLGLHPAAVAVLAEALAAHGGEMERMPYHLFYPARLMNNVWRGAELVGGFGAKAPGFIFGELYRISELFKGAITRIEPGMFAGPSDKIPLGLLSAPGRSGHFFYS